MRTHLSSQISLNRVSPRYYRPENAVERSVLTQFEKLPTNIFETSEEGIEQIANEIAAKIQDRQREGKFCTMAAATAASSADGKGNPISLKVMTLNNSRQKINDCFGNPIEIGIAVTWRVVDTAKAVFEVDNYKEYLSLQCDSALRNIVRLYPYDVAPNVDTTGDGIADEGSLRGSSETVAARIKDEIQDKVTDAGLEILEARITYLAYAPEIAAVMLQRQQASAIIDARKMIVDGAVGMVEMALNQLNENGVVELDEERKAAMVSNLLVVLCGNHDTQPIINTGSLY